MYYHNKRDTKPEFEFTRFQPTSSYMTLGGEQIKYKTQIHSYMINAYYDFNTDSCVESDMQI